MNFTKHIKLTLFFLLLSFTFFAQSLDGVLLRADQMPYFPSCDKFKNNTQEKRTCSNETLVSFISNNIEYPDTAKDQGIEGVVIASFIVDESGTVLHPYIIRDIGGGCGDEAIKVLEQMPRWEPAVHEKKKVKVKLNIPIQFYLKNENEIASQFEVTWGRFKGNQISKDEIKTLLNQNIIARDQLGNEVRANSISFSYEKKKKYLEASSNGKITEEMKKIVKKSKPDGVFTITVTVQQKGELIRVRREFVVRKK